MDKKIRIQSLAVESNITILEALKKMDETFSKLLLVFDKNNFINVLSVGDIQRAIIRNLPLETSISKILRKETRLANINESFESIKSQMLKYKAEFMPVINDENVLIDVYFWEELFEEYENLIIDKINLPVVIMAGGKGSRMRPLTHVLPKPLIPIGENTIIEEIINRFIKYGCHDFYISLNYKAEMIKHFFNQKTNIPPIQYIQEEKPLGTAGSLFLLKNKISSTFFVTNCDILIEEDYNEIYNYHVNNKNELTIVAALKHYHIPYGTIKTGLNGVLESLNEKPDLTFKINSGMYILESSILDEIPENQFFHITTLIDKVKKRGGKIGVFPVSEGSWKDIGTWDEYLLNLKLQSKNSISRGL